MVTEQILHTVQAGENWPDIAKEVYGDWTRWEEIVANNPRYASRPPHRDPAYKITSPVLYRGDSVFVKVETEEPLPKEEPQPKQDSRAEQSANPQDTTKEPIIGIEDVAPIKSQSPNPIIEVFLKSSDGKNADYTFTASPNDKDKEFATLQSYNFSEAVDDINGSFSFTIVNKDIGNSTLFDLITLRSVIKIHEGGKAAFVGIIRRRHISKQMTAQGVKRVITFSGKSITSCVAEYTISLDIMINKIAMQALKEVKEPKEPMYALAKVKNDQLSIRLGNLYTKNNFKITMKDFIGISWDYFNNLAIDIKNGLEKTTQGNAAVNIEVAEMIKKYLGDLSVPDDDAKQKVSPDDEFVTISGKEQDIRYPIICQVFSEKNNTIVDLWQTMLPRPVYEFFSYCTNEGKPRIIIRQVPFGDYGSESKDKCDDWSRLAIYSINPNALIAYELSQNDEEVYTAFSSFLIGSVLEQRQREAISGDYVKYDKDKIGIYGFKPLRINFRGYNREYDKKEGIQNDMKTALKVLNERAMYWFGRLDEMYSGTITLCTNFADPDFNPRVGCRAKFLGGEFYIEKTEHAWSYGGTPTIKLTVSRGMMYNNDGSMGKTIPDIGRQYREMESEG
jgi:hypothetical protein